MTYFIYTGYDQPDHLSYVSWARDMKINLKKPALLHRKYTFNKKWINLVFEGKEAACMVHKHMFSPAVPAKSLEDYL